MLSGIGPADVLRRHGIEPRVPLPGVGTNLQDRYEVGVVNRMNMQAWEVYRRTRPSAPAIRSSRSGPAAGRASMPRTARSSRSSSDRRPMSRCPDLFCMALLANFQGYYPGYSGVFAKDLNALTWVVLKGHTTQPRRHRDAALGRSARHAGDQLQLLHGWRRRRSESGRGRHPVRPPGDAQAARARPGRHGKRCPATTSSAMRSSPSSSALNAWGHHACGTCAIGPPETNGVLSSDFRVHQHAEPARRRRLGVPAHSRASSSSAPST